MTLDDDGNNDGRADPGETCELDFIITNDPRAQIGYGVVGELTCDDPAVNITSAVQNFGDVYPSWTAMNTNPFVFSVSPTDPHFTEFTLTLNTASGQSFPISFDIELGRPPILVVADDGGFGIDYFYTFSFEQLGVFVDVWYQNEEEITGAELQRYDAVVWATGASASTLNSNEITALQQLLDAGGNLLFSSSNAGPDIGGTSFYSNYLHASFLDDSVGIFTLDGVSSCPFSNGTSVFLVGGTGSGNNQSLESINPANGSEIAFQYSTNSEPGGVYYAGSYKVVYLSFPLDAVSGLIGTSRNVILSNIMVWFGVPMSVEGGEKQVIPEAFALLQNYPNPFNPATRLSFTLPHDAKITLKVYNCAGQEVAALAEGLHQAGYHTAYFDGANLSSGIYIARLEAEGMVLSQKMVLLK